MSDGNQLFWKAYASTIRDIMTSGPIGDNTRVYIAPNNTDGICGGKNIPKECTNYGIFQYADFLLDPKNPNWVASKTSRYSEALNAALTTLTPNGDGDTTIEAKIRANDAKEILKIRQKEKDEARVQAEKDFKQDDNPDKPKYFAQWYPLNADAYVVAIKNFVAAANEVQQRTSKIGGAGSALLADAMKQAAAGVDGQKHIPGCNMKANPDSVNFDAAGNAIAPSEDACFYVPRYTIQQYGALLDGWITNKNQKPSSFDFDLSTGSDFSYKDIGFTEAQGEASFKRFPVFDFHASGGGRVEHANFDMRSNAKDVRVTLNIQHYKIVTLQPGNWNVNVNDLIAKMKAEAPPMQQKVRPTQILVAQGISMNVSFSGSAKTAFDKDYKKTVQGGGAISVFGLRISGSGSSSEETASHGHTWDSSSGSLNIAAENAAHSANVLAVLGEIVTV